MRDPRGTFVALKPKRETALNLYLWCMRNSIPNPVKPEDLHCTLIHSPDFVPGFYPRERIMVPIIVPIIVPSHKVKYSKFGPNREVLVLTLYSSDIESRHYQLKNYGFTTTYDPRISAGYRAHMTLSYEYGAAEISNLPDFRRSFRRPVVFVEEFSSELRSNFNEKEADKWDALRFKPS